MFRDISYKYDIHIFNIDDIIETMTSPMMVSYTVKDVEEKIPIAVTHRKNDDGLNEFVDIRKNRVFWSAHVDGGMAYTEYAEKCGEIRKMKASEERTKKGVEMTKMTKLMKCVMISYFESVHTRNLQALSIEDIISMVKNPTAVFGSIIKQYFQVGAAMQINVNNPKAVFDLIMTEFLDQVIDVVAGNEGLSDKDEIEMYMESSKFFDTD